MTILRSKATQKKYDAYIVGGVGEGCVLCQKEPINSFTHWKIVSNDFPYDRIAKTHHMIVPIRHSDESELTDDEVQELRTLKETYIADHYDDIIEATRHQKSIPHHFHLHIIVEDT